MDPELRWRLDLIVGLLTFIALSVAALVLWTGGLPGLAVVLAAGLLLALLVQGLGGSPTPQWWTR
jgi:predicted lysophospholipase L1 biosynthesis ABC-type transport system permease subunit